MSRLADINTFYHIIDEIERKIGKKELLLNYISKYNLPERGIYFFFESSEFRENNDDMRIVRIGAHAITSKSKTTLWQRLRNHRGNINGGHTNGGNHRGSIFRLHVGTAIINKENIDISSWGNGSSATRVIRDKEYFLERKVSRVIRKMPFLWIKIEDSPSNNSDRKYIEKNVIALLSNYKKEVKIDKATKNWLGSYATNEKIKNSGLWNVEHVDGDYDPGFLEIFKGYVEAM